METLTEVARSSKQIKFQGFSVIPAMSDGEVLKSSRWNVGGYDWEVQLFPKTVVIHLYLRSEVCEYSDVKVTFNARLVDQNGKLWPYQGIRPVSHKFKSSGDGCNGGVLMDRSSLQASGYLKDDAFIVECTLAVLRELDKNATTHRRRPADFQVPSTRLNHHLGELLHKGTGADVTLVAAGESFAAHKAILASRSPVFMAEFFGHMKEKHSQRVEIQDMDAAILGAMLRFIYTDSVPELEDGAGEVGHMAQHLLVAADRYEIDRLMLVCEDKLFDGVTVDTAATTLALAEQHGCCDLKARCVELIAANLEAVIGTEGYEHLKASCPSVMDDLLIAVHERKN